MSNYSNSRFNDDPNSSWNKTFKLIPEGTTVLDVGCSSGKFGETLQKTKDCIVDGIEINKDDIKKARQNLRKVYELNIENDEIKIDNKYDCIFMGDVIEHLAQPIPALRKTRALLKPEGQIVFSIPNITHMSVRLMLLEGKIEYGKTGLLDETHLHFYNREEIIRVFNEAGFEINHLDYTVNDIPPELAKNLLAKLGLKSTSKFKQLLQSTNAATYQFVGTAIKSNTVKKQALPSSSPLNVVDNYINELKHDYEKTIIGLQNHIKQINEDRDRIQAKLDKTISGRTRKYAKKLIRKKKTV